MDQFKGSQPPSKIQGGLKPPNPLPLPTHTL